MEDSRSGETTDTASEDENHKPASNVLNNKVESQINEEHLYVKRGNNEESSYGYCKSNDDKVKAKKRKGPFSCEKDQFEFQTIRNTKMKRIVIGVEQC